MDVVRNVFRHACNNRPHPSLMHNGLPIGAFFCFSANTYPAMWGYKREYRNALEQKLRGYVLVKHVNLRNEDGSGLGMMVIWSELANQTASAWNPELQAAKIEIDEFLNFFCRRMITKNSKNGKLIHVSISISHAYDEWESALGKPTVVSQIQSPVW
jgi:hypothetical protein